MKKYLGGFAALLLCVFALAFTNKKAPATNIAQINSNIVDVCDEADKLYYKIDLPCSSQVPFNVNTLRTASNYSLFGTTGTVAPNKTTDCPGSTCICVIKACPDPAFGGARPLISTASVIYGDI